LTEGHLQAITWLVFDVTLSPWLTTEQAWVELAEQIVKDKAKSGCRKNSDEGGKR